MHLTRTRPSTSSSSASPAGRSTGTSSKRGAERYREADRDGGRSDRTGHCHFKRRSKPMFTRLGKKMYRYRRRVALVWIAVLVLGVTLGSQSFQRATMDQDGPDTEATRAEQRL